jgi:hypothetical protein
MSIIKMGMGVLFASHWLACLLRLIPDMEQQTLANGEPNSWMTSYTLMDCSEDAPCPISEALPGEQYAVALYWSVMTLTTVGYGDVVAKTTGERILFVVCMILGGSCYAYIVGTLTEIIVQGDKVRRP